MVFTSTLNYQLTPEESDIDALVDRLAEECCDDALVGSRLIETDPAPV